MSFYIAICSVISIVYYSLFLLGVVGQSVILELVIWLSFVAFFITRLQKTEKKLKFIFHQYLDWFVLIPIFLFSPSTNSDFVRFVILVTLTYDYILDFAEDNLLKRPLMLVIISYTITMLTASIGFVRFENIGLGEGMWLAFISSTTVGYGDVSAVTIAGKLVTVYVVVAGTIIFGAILISIVMYLIEERRKTMIAELEANDDKYENIEYLEAKFKDFKLGNISINELEQAVYKEIGKEDK